MKTPAKRITTALQDYAVSNNGADPAGLDDMASHNLAGFFGALFEIDQRLQAENRQPKEPRHEN